MKFTKLTLTKEQHKSLVINLPSGSYIIVDDYNLLMLQNTYLDLLADITSQIRFDYSTANIYINYT